jgi:hypothetical protein
MRTTEARRDARPPTMSADVQAAVDEFACAMRQMCRHQIRVLIVGMSVMVVVYTGIFAAFLALLHA